jgi:hypothetical protein
VKQSKAKTEVNFFITKQIPNNFEYVFLNELFAHDNLAQTVFNDF